MSKRKGINLDMIGAGFKMSKAFKIKSVGKMRRKSPVKIRSII